MSFLNCRWWYLFLSCYLIKLIAYTSVDAQHFQISTPQEVVHNAMFIPHGQPLTSSTSTIAQPYDFSQLIFPFMNFTCGGNIRRMMYLARLERSECSTMSTPRTEIWPHFYLWRRTHSHNNRNYNYHDMHSIGTVHSIVCHNVDVLDTPSRDYQVGLIEMRLATSGITFEEGDALGLQQQTTQSVITPTQSSVHVSVLRQKRGYGLTFHCSRGAYHECNEPVPDQVNREYYQQMPYIAVETDPEQECAVGFLDEQSLQMIVNVTSARSAGAHPSVYLYSYTRIPQSATSMPLTQSGPLKKLIIAAEFDVTASAGWPVLQIIRNATNHTYVVFTTNTIEPKPTGYLNVYEYDVSNDTVQINVGDVLNISWRTNEEQSDRNRFSLACYNGTSSKIPMVSIVVGDCDSDTNLLTLNSLYCAEGSESTIISDAMINMNQNSSKLNAVIGGIISCYFLLIILLILVITCVIIKRRRKKFASINTVDSTEMNTYICELDTSRNKRGRASENDYFSDDRAPSSGAQASAVLHNNPQDDCYYYNKLYEWGVFVPTVDQRGKVSSTSNNNDAVYSTLGESQYSTLQQFNKAPHFFENCDNYWKPASDAEGLYQQLSSKKYREILRQQIRLSDSLGSGQFGNVMKGVWVLSGGSKEVAVKMLKEEASETEKVRFLQEAAINGQFWHPNVVKLMGVVTIGEPVMIVLEFLSNGNLRGYLIKMQPTPGEMVPSNTPHTLLRFCKEIAAGMKYLASKGFVHRDLAARNILVSEEKTCKISDFGMSRDLENESYYISCGGMIPVKWTAPEALHYKKYSTLSDVWSFGCVVYEIWSLGHKPFEEYSKHEVIRKVDSGFRLPPPPGCPRDIYHIMIQCWHPNKNLRSSFFDLHTSLSDHTLSLGMKESQSKGPDQPLPLHPQAHTIGAPLEAGKELFTDLQNTYINM